MNLNPTHLLSRTTKGASALALMFPLSLPVTPLTEDPPAVATVSKEKEEAAPQDPAKSPTPRTSTSTARSSSAGTPARASGRPSAPAARDEGGSNKLRLGLGINVGGEETTLTDDFGSSELQVDTTDFSLDMGYRFAPHFEVGGLLSLFDQDTDEPDGGSVKETAYLFGPQARAYFTADGEFQPWVSLGLGLAWGDVEDSEPGFSTIQGDVDGSFVQFALGMSYFPSRWAAIEASINFREVTSDLTLSDDFGNSATVDYDISSTFFKVGISMFF